LRVYLAAKSLPLSTPVLYAVHAAISKAGVSGGGLPHALMIEGAVTEALKPLSEVADISLVDLSRGIRREIADREAEELKFREADQEFWKHPEHDRQANAEYEKRRQRLVSLRKQLRELYRELMTLR
jgi:hypothetical protein